MGTHLVPSGRRPHQGHGCGCVGCSVCVSPCCAFRASDGIEEDQSNGSHGVDGVSCERVWPTIYVTCVAIVARRPRRRSWVSPDVLDCVRACVLCPWLRRCLCVQLDAVCGFQVPCPDSGREIRRHWFVFYLDGTDEDQNISPLVSPRSLARCLFMGHSLKPGTNASSVYVTCQSFWKHATWLAKDGCPVSQDEGLYSLIVPIRISSFGASQKPKAKSIKKVSDISPETSITMKHDSDPMKLD